jgi:hypothetical protein
MSMATQTQTQTQKNIQQIRFPLLKLANFSS